MSIYDIAAFSITGICHLYLYILLIRYQRMSKRLIVLLSVLFMLFLGIIITITKMPELNFVVFFLFLMIIGSMQKKLKFWHSIYFALFSIVVFTVLKNLLALVVVQLYMESPFNLYTWTGNVIHLAVVSLILLCIILFRKKIQLFGQFIIQSKLFLPTYFLLAISIGLLVVINYPSLPFLASFNGSYGNQIAISILLLFLLLILTTIIGMHLSKEKLQEKHEQVIYEQLMDYVGKLEDMHDELATFRHDYTNILLSLEEGIRTKNIDQLQQIYYKTIAPTSSVINHQQLELTKLSRITVPEVKSILSVKVLTAQQKKLDVCLDIPHEICQLLMPTDQFIRIIAILIDNAIEEAIKTNQRILRISFFEMNAKTHYFIVQNSCVESAIDLQTLFEKEVSSKDGSRGFGLFSLKRLIDQSSNITLHTAIDTSIFTQTLIIKSDDFQ